MFLGRQRAPLPFVARTWVWPALDPGGRVAVASYVPGSAPRSAPIRRAHVGRPGLGSWRSLRCRLLCSWVGSALRSHSSRARGYGRPWILAVASLSPPMFLGRLRAPLPFVARTWVGPALDPGGRFAVASYAP